MKYDVHITDTTTGETRVAKEFGDWDEDKGSYYLWSDGNFGCDCNRYLFFERAGGKEPEVGDMDCNSVPNRFRVVIKASVNAHELYRDDEGS